ncbi:hypothetical protein [Citricoccus sp. K5]|uniref:hypothetical protein n=1 Tax=Citricoccus sp. K5 TaxID=2653135 RepID=UPI0012F387E6|nr:hypothetical protein [Citricoccus sp. K5]VXB52523.1 conserved membrane hypothetical protein [Citricoccus sp. K5]
MKDMEEFGLFAGVFLVGGLLLLLLGINAYRGVYRGWLVRPSIFQGYLGPGLLYAGIGALMIGSTPLATLWTGTGPTWMSGVAFVVLFFGGILAVITGFAFAQWGMPARLRPGWVREIEGLPTTPGGPEPVASELAPAWSTVTAGRADVAVYSPPLGLIPARTMAAVEWSLVGKARTRQRDETELGRLRSWGLLDDQEHPTRAASLLMSRKARKDAATYRLEADPPGTRHVVATPLNGVTVLEFRQDWDGRGLNVDQAQGSWDVVSLTDPEQVSELVHGWIVSAP